MVARWFESTAGDVRSRQTEKKGWDMSGTETYNGWSNRESWAFMLNVQNDEGLADTVRDVVAGGWFGPARSPADSLMDWADVTFTRNGYVGEYGGPWPDALADAASDIGSLWRVNWVECADSLAAE